MAETVPGRECGDCTVCCIVPGIDTREIQKLTGAVCRHCSGHGCAVYETRPQACRDFFCAWMQMPGLDASWRPNQSGVFLQPIDFKGRDGLSLMRIADAVQKVKGNVLVTGHSDNRPIATLRFPSNWKLSQARAQEVAEILAAKTGDATRFKAEGRSDTEPVTSNATNEGRAKNRRVEITVFAEGVE